MILIWLQSSGFSDPFVSQFVGGRRTGPDVVRTADKGISTVKKNTHCKNNGQMLQTQEWCKPNHIRQIPPENAKMLESQKLSSSENFQTHKTNVK